MRGAIDACVPTPAAQSSGPSPGPAPSSSLEPRARLRTALAILLSHGAPLALGAGLALAWRAGPKLAADFEPGPPTTWVADRDAQALVGLDDELFEARRIELASPVEVELAQDGGLWAVSASESHPLGRHDLVRYAVDGARSAALTFGPVYDLDRLGPDALVVERQGALGRVVRVTLAGEVLAVAELANARCASGSGSRAVVGTDDGEVWLFDAAHQPPRVLARRELAGPIGDLRPGPTPGTWWALDVGGVARLSLLEPTLATRWTVEVGLHALHIAPARGVERVWVADTTQPVVRRYGPGGALELDLHDLPHSGLDRGVALEEGGVLLVAPGAVLRLDERGELQPGQGGFDFLVDLAR